MNETMIHELLYQTLETEIAGTLVYRAAVACAVNVELKKEWQKYLEETAGHVEVVKEVFNKVGLDRAHETPGRAVVRHLGEALVRAMQLARRNGGTQAAELVAAECVVTAETKSHRNWELVGELIQSSEISHRIRDALIPAYETVEEQEDEHLYHTMGWARELWIQSLGMPAVLPPPEEQQHAVTAIGAALAHEAREAMLKSP